MAKYQNTPVDNQIFDLSKDDRNDPDPSNSAHICDLEYKAPELIETLNGATVLDIGCGYSSAFIADLKRMSAGPVRIVHIDADARVFAPGGELGDWLDSYWKRDLKACADAHSLPFRSETFDWVYSYGALMDNYVRIPGKNPFYFTGRQEAFDRRIIQREIFRVLKPNGVYFGDAFIGEWEKDPIEGFKDVGKHITFMRLLRKL